MHSVFMLTEQVFSDQFRLHFGIQSIRLDLNITVVLALDHSLLWLAVFRLMLIQFPLSEFLNKFLDFFRILLLFIKNLHSLNILESFQFTLNLSQLSFHFQCRLHILLWLTFLTWYNNILRQILKETIW
jgi:hypothetical protein